MRRAPGAARWRLALVLAVALAASATSLANGFVYDDVPVIQKDARVHSLDLSALLRAPFWPSDYRSNAYRPATTVAFALDWAVGGGRPIAFHATNVALNLLVVVLVLALASRVLVGAAAVAPAPGRDRADGAKEGNVGGAVSAAAVAPAPGRDRADGAKEGNVGGAVSAGATVAALWFAVSPVHVEAVAGCVGLAELLAAAAYLAALLAYIADGDEADAGTRGGPRRALLSLAVLFAAAVACFAKESAITLPAVLLLADAWLAHRSGNPIGARVRGHWLLWLGVVAVAAGYLVARGAVLGHAFSGGAVAVGLMGESVAGRALVMAPALLVWLRWLVWPVHLSADYSPDAFVPSAALGLGQLAGFAALALLVWAAWACRRRAPGVMAGIGFAIVTASVAANLVVPTGVVLAERLSYLPSVGAAFVAGAVWEKLPRGRLLWPATAVVLALLAARTLARIPIWKDRQDFLRALALDAPDSYRTHWALGAEAFEHGAFGTGEREMLTAIRINPLDAAPVQELGERYLEAGLFARAARYLSAAYRLDTASTGAAARAAFAYLKENAPDSAVAVARSALRRFPDDPVLLAMTETAYLAAGRPRQALALARRLVYADPRASRYQVLAAYAAAAAGRCSEARAWLERAAALEPGAGEARARLGRWRVDPGCGLSPLPPAASGRRAERGARP